MGYSLVRALVAGVALVNSSGDPFLRLREQFERAWVGTTCGAEGLVAEILIYTHHWWLGRDGVKQRGHWANSHTNAHCFARHS